MSARTVWVAGVLVWSAFVSMAAGASAQDAAVPSQDVATDSDVPYYRLAVTTDPSTAAIYATYTLQIEVAFAPSHSAWIMPFYSAWKSDFIALGFGYHFWLAGEGTQGFFIGPHFALGSLLGDEGGFGAGGGVELGYQVVWEGLVLGIAVGFNQLWAPSSSKYAGDVLPRIHAAIGYAWM